MQIKETNREYTKKYIWHKFKYSSLTIAGLVVPSISSISMMIADLPVNLQLINILSLVAMVGGSYWWHWFYDVEALAKSGSLEYLKSIEEKKTTDIYQRYKDLEITLKDSQKHHNLHQKLMIKFDDFNKTLEEQKIIDLKVKKRFKKKSVQAFSKAIEISTEISDILVVQRNIDINEIEKMSEKSPKQKEIFNQIKNSYNENSKKLQNLTSALETIIHSYTLAISNTALITSKTSSHSKIESALELQNAIDVAKKVQSKIASISENVTDVDSSYTQISI